MAADDGIPLSWIVLFLLAALGIGAWAIFYVGGNLTGAAGAIPL